LQTRLFRYPCSYLIYSDAFRALPDPVRQRIYTRLVAILTGQDPTTDLRAPAADQATLIEILTETDPGFAAALWAARG
jgi:hypothetical protein